MKVLVAPLDWGLGHATRCVPLVRALLAEGHEPILAAGGKGHAFFQNEFPHLKNINFPGYPVRYARSRRWFVPMIYRHVPGFLRSIAQEHLALRRLHRKLGFDAVISDNRYGLHSRDFPCVFVSHQLFIRSPRGPMNTGPRIERLLVRIAAGFTRRYTEVWVPDFPGVPNLSGDLAHRPNRMGNLRYIGPLTSFQTEADALAFPPPPPQRIDLFAAISGVEPLRTVLEEILQSQIGTQSGTRVLALGLPDRAGSAKDVLPTLRTGELNIFPHLNRAQMEQCLRAADTVICRSGYTTVMEVAVLGKKRVLMIPTPGQTEQEYIGEFLQAQNIALTRDQDNVNLPADLPRLAQTQGFSRFAERMGEMPPLTDVVRTCAAFNGSWKRPAPGKTPISLFRL